MKYKIGFWNYVETGVLDPEKAVEDWKALGMNTPMSFEFNPEKHDKKDMLQYSRIVKIRVAIGVT